MRPPPAPVRRAVLDPLWPPLAAALTALLLLAAAVGALAWPVTTRRRVPRIALLAALYLAVDAGLVLACAGLWLRHPVASRRDERRWQAAHLGLLAATLRALRSAAATLLGFSITVEEPPDAAALAGAPLLVLARHAGPGDSFALVDLLLSRYGRRPRIVLKDTLQWDPGLDVLLGRLSACFLPGRAGAHGTDERPELMAELARSLRGDDAMLLFPEGGNWTPRRWRQAMRRLRRRGGPAATDAARNPNVLPPRPAGVLACLAARPDASLVVVAHTGLDDLVSPLLVWRALPLHDRAMTVRWWHVPAGAVPAAPERQPQWLRVQWALVDSWIDARRAQSGLPPLSAQPAGDDGDDGDQDADPVLEAPG